MVTDVAADLGCDSAKDTVGVDDEWWEAKLKVVPKAAKFQKRAPEHLDDLEIIFSHTMANGEFACMPNSGKRLGKKYMVRENGLQLLDSSVASNAENVAEENDPQLEGSGGSNAAEKTGVEQLDAFQLAAWTTHSGKPLFQVGIVSMYDLPLVVGSRDSGKEYVLEENGRHSMEGKGNSNGRDNIGLENITAETPIYAKTDEENDGRKTHRITDHEFNSQKEEKKARTIQGAAATLSNEPDCICEAESRSSAKSSTTSMMTRTTGSSIAEVMLLMESIPDIEPASELYMLGTRLFINRENREMFVALKTQHVPLAWLKQELAREGQNEPYG